MLRYIARRLLWMIVLLFLVCFVTFLVFYVFPSADPAQLRAGRHASPAQVEQIRQRMGLDKPLLVQFWDYLKGIVTRADFGYSYVSEQPVSKLVLDRLPATISLAVGGALLWLISGVAIGIVSAVRRHSKLDRFLMGLALIGISAPVYWLGLVALYLFASDIGMLPIASGSNTYQPITSSPSSWFNSLLLPWIVLAISFAAFYSRLLRSNLIEVMGEDYIRTARAKGLSERRVVLHHGVRSAITPIVTVFGLDLGVLLGGALLTEIVFNIPGVGRLAYDSILRADLPMIQATVLLGALFIIVANLVVDVAYAFLDPRVRFE
ncbi:MAG: ABC transporter permease [Actinomycetes bacterium]